MARRRRPARRGSPVNPRSEAAENRDLLDLFDCTCLIFQAAFAPLIAKILPDLPKLTTLVCLDGDPAAPATSLPFERWLDGVAGEPWQAEPDADDIVMVVGTGGTTGRPKGVIMAAPDLARFLALIEQHQITHTFLPPTLIYMLLDHPALSAADLASLQCLWYGAAPMSVSRLHEALRRIGPVMGQLFGQTEAPMMISAMAPADHFNADGTIAGERLSSAGRPTPLTRVGIMDDDGTLLRPGQRGEIVVRGPLVMAGYYKDPAASAEASRHGWHHTADIGYLNEENYLFIVDRAKDMIITGGFNVYSAEVEQVLMTHPAVQDCAVIGLPDEKWGERVVAVVQPRLGETVTEGDVRAFVKGSAWQREST